MSPACCADRLHAGDRLIVLHAGTEATAGTAVWPDWSEGCAWTEWAHWSSWASARELDVVGLDVSLGAGDAVAALTHVLWWDPSVRGVLVAADATDAGACVEEIRAAMSLTGSTATLLVDTGGSMDWSR